MLDLSLTAILDWNPGTIKLAFKEVKISALEETFSLVKIHG